MSKISIEAIQQRQQDKLDRLSKLATDTMEEHGLISKGWAFVWNNHIRSLGMCSYRKKEIQLSKRWMISVPEKEVIDTILHEIAHALTPGASHGRLWKEACIRIGASPEVYASSENTVVTTKDVASPTHELVDTTTGKVVKNYYRKPNATTYRNIKHYYVRGRKEETIGKLTIREISLLEML